MKVIIQGKLLSIFKKPDFKDKATGEVTEGKQALQILVDTELQNGSIRSDLQDITIPVEKLKEYEAKIGQKVQVQCNFISKSNVSFYVK